MADGAQVSDFENLIKFNSKEGFNLLPDKIIYMNRKQIPDKQPQRKDKLDGYGCYGLVKFTTLENHQI